MAKIKRLEDDTDYASEALIKRKRTLKSILEQRKDAVEYWRESHISYRSQKDFADGEQWREGEEGNDIFTRETFNILNGLIIPAVNAVRENPPAISVLPAGAGADKQQANLLAGAIRAIEYQSSATVAYCYALDCCARGGLGAWRTLAVQGPNDTLIQTEIIYDPTTVYMDPESTQPGYADAKFVFHKFFVPRSSYRRDYGDIPDDSTQGETEAEAPSNSVTLWELWQLHRDEQSSDDEDGVEVLTTLDHYVFTDSQILTYEIGLPLHKLPYSMVTGRRVFKDHHVIYHGITHDAESSQRAFNYFASEVVNRISTYPRNKWLAESGAWEDEDAVGNASTEPDNTLYHKPGRMVELMPQPEPPTAFMDILDKIVDWMHLCTGVMYDQSVNDTLKDQSGEAIKQQLQQSAIGFFHYVDALKIAIRNCGDITLDLINAYWNDNRLRPVRMIDGTSKLLSIGDEEVPDVSNATFYYGQYNVTISTGSSYASQHDAMMDNLQALIPQSGPAQLPLLCFWLMQLNVPGSEEAADLIKLTLPPEIQSYFNQEDKLSQLSPSEQIKQLLQITQQQQQQLQQMQQTGQDAAQVIQGLHKEITDNDAKLQLETQKMQLDAVSRDKDRAMQKEIAELKAQVEILIKMQGDKAAMAIAAGKDSTSMQVEHIKAHTDITKTHMEAARDFGLATMNAGQDQQQSTVATATR